MDQTRGPTLVLPSGKPVPCFECGAPCVAWHHGHPWCAGHLEMVKRGKIKVGYPAGDANDKSKQVGAQFDV